MRTLRLASCLPRRLAGRGGFSSGGGASLSSGVATGTFAFPLITRRFVGGPGVSNPKGSGGAGFPREISRGRDEGASLRVRESCGGVGRARRGLTPLVPRRTLGGFRGEASPRARPRSWATTVRGRRGRTPRSRRGSLVSLGCGQGSTDERGTAAEASLVHESVEDFHVAGGHA